MVVIPSGRVGSKGKWEVKPITPSGRALARWSSWDSVSKRYEDFELRRTLMETMGEPGDDLRPPASLLETPMGLMEGLSRSGKY